MSEERPTKPLDYEPPRNRPPGATGLFVLWAILGTILTPVIVTGAVFVAASMSGSTGGFVTAGAALVAVAGAGFAIVRATEPGPRRSAVMAGMLTGVGVAALLIGACFAIVLKGL